MNDCIFCSIRDGEIPAQKVYEDDAILVILDINPVNPGHALIIPKKHSINMLDTDDETLAQLAVVSKKVASAVMGSLDYQAFNLEVNNGEAAGQIVPHAHWHIVPRKVDDGLKHWLGHPYETGVDVEIAQKIKSEIK